MGISGFAIIRVEDAGILAGSHQGLVGFASGPVERSMGAAFEVFGVFDWQALVAIPTDESTASFYDSSPSP
jgi:hypothetical protein